MIAESISQFFKGVHPRFLNCVALEEFADSDYDPRKNPPERIYAKKRTLTKEGERFIFVSYNWLKYQLGDLKRSLVDGDYVEKYGYFRRKVGELDDVLDEVRRYEEKLVKSNIPLVNLIIKHLPSTTLERILKASHDVADLFSECCISLLRSIEEFDVTKGYKFSTYASRGASLTLKTINNRIQTKKRENPYRKSDSSREDLSQDVFLSNIGYKRRSTEEREEVDLSEALEDLSDEEKAVIFWRYGLNGSPNYQFEQIGAWLGHGNTKNSRQVIARRINQRALSKLKDKITS